MEINVKTIRYFLLLVLAFFILVFFYLALAPSGRMSLDYDFMKPSYEIKKITPIDRVEPVNGGSQKIIGNPVYFTLVTPRPFDTAVLELKFKNPAELPIVEAGVLADKKIWRYHTQPLENNLLDELEKNWNVLKKGELSLFQRTKKFDSIENFLENLPDKDSVALFNHNLQKKYLLSNYSKSDQKKTINHSLRGAYQFYTYVKDEALDFSFYLTDLNKNKEADQIEVKVYSDNDIVHSQTMNDDGNKNDNGAKSSQRIMDLKIPEISEGVYKVEILVNDDIVTDKIETSQRKIAFINKLWLSNSLDPNVKIKTNSQAINFQTTNPAKLQKVKINDSDLVIGQTYRQYSIASDKSDSEIILEKDDVIISGDGLFSFDEEELLNPEFKKINSNFHPDNSQINFVLADYTAPEIVDGWKKSVVKLDLKSAYKEKASILGATTKYSFIISVPGLKADDELKDFIEISGIKIDLNGTSLWKKILKIIKGEM